MTQVCPVAAFLYSLQTFHDMQRFLVYLEQCFLVYLEQLPAAITWTPCFLFLYLSLSSFLPLCLFLSLFFFLPLCLLCSFAFALLSLPSNFPCLFHCTCPSAYVHARHALRPYDVQAYISTMASCIRALPPLATPAETWQQCNTSAAQQHALCITMMIWCQRYSQKRFTMKITDCGLDANDTHSSDHCTFHMSS